VVIGVWLFELTAVTDPAAVPDAVAPVQGIIHHRRFRRGQPHGDRGFA
jgi:hypothetical protein